MSIAPSVIVRSNLRWRSFGNQLGSRHAGQHSTGKLELPSSPPHSLWPNRIQNIVQLWLRVGRPSSHLSCRKRRLPSTILDRRRVSLATGGKRNPAEGCARCHAIRPACHQQDRPRPIRRSRSRRTASIPSQPSARAAAARRYLRLAIAQSHVAASREFTP